MCGNSFFLSALTTDFCKKKMNNEVETIVIN